MVQPRGCTARFAAGMVFVDVGCGDGFFSILAAKKVGEKGRVYAVDSDASAIEKLNRKAQAEGLKNIVSKVGSAEETVFCVGCADFVFFSMVLHDFADPAKVLQNARKMVKPTGTLVDLDWKKQEMPFGPPLKIRFSEDHASSLIHDAGFRVDGVRDSWKLPLHCNRGAYALKVNFVLLWRRVREGRV